MKPMLSVPIGIANSDKEEKQVSARFFPELVEYYYPGFHYGTVVVMRNGHSFLTLLDTDAFDTLMETYSDNSFAIIHIEPKKQTPNDLRKVP